MEEFIYLFFLIYLAVLKNTFNYKYDIQNNAYII